MSARFHPYAALRPMRWSDSKYSDLVLDCGAKLHRPREVACWDVGELSLPELSGLLVCGDCLRAAERCFDPPNGEGKPLVDWFRYMYVIREGQESLDMVICE